METPEESSHADWHAHAGINRSRPDSDADDLSLDRRPKLPFPIRSEISASGRDATTGGSGGITSKRLSYTDQDAAERTIKSRRSRESSSTSPPEIDYEGFRAEIDERRLEIAPDFVDFHRRRSRSKSEERVLVLPQSSSTPVDAPTRTENMPTAQAPEKTRHVTFRRTPQFMPEVGDERRILSENWTTGNRKSNSRLKS